MLTIKNLSQAKGNKTLFRNLCCQFSKGQLIVVQGENGAGKSTLLKIIAGLLSPDKGKVVWHEVRAEHISYLGHQNGLKKNLTPIENIQELLALANVTVPLTAIEQLLQQFQLQEQAKQLCGTLSAGECRKVALAAVLLKNKAIWILDEPFNSLDKASYDKMQTYCQQHIAKGGMIILSTHQGSHHYEDCHRITLC